MLPDTGGQELLQGHCGRDCIGLSVSKVRYEVKTPKDSFRALDTAARDFEMQAGLSTVVLIVANVLFADFGLEECCWFLGYDDQHIKGPTNNGLPHEFVGDLDRVFWASPVRVISSWEIDVTAVCEDFRCVGQKFANILEQTVVLKGSAS